MPKTAAEINAERIEAIIRDQIETIIAAGQFIVLPLFVRREIARKIVEAFPELQPPQYTSERDGTSRIVVTPLPWGIER